MAWKIEFYDEIVEASIKKWPEAMVPKFLWLLNLIEKVGPDKIDTPSIKALGNGLFKINAKSHKDIGCALFCVSAQENRVIILDGFTKMTPKKMLDRVMLAQNRMHEIYLKEI
jgi:phage-related protein